MPPSGDDGRNEQTVRIYPATNIHRELGRADANQVLDWFRANGVSPTAVPMDDLVEITDVIDFWWYSDKEPSDPTWQTLETQPGAPYSRTHHRARVSVPLPEKLAVKLRGLAARFKVLP